MTAASDSTTLFMNTMMYYICINSKVMEKCRKEVGKVGREVGFEVIRGMEYLDWVQM